MLTCFFPPRNIGWGQRRKKIRKTGVPVEHLLLAGKHTGGTPAPISNYCHLLSFNSLSSSNPNLNKKLPANVHIPKKIVWVRIQNS